MKRAESERENIFLQGVITISLINHLMSEGKTSAEISETMLPL